jgi:hypothetical protein
MIDPVPCSTMLVRKAFTVRKVEVRSDSITSRQ